MSRLADIPIRIEAAGGPGSAEPVSTGGLGGGISAILAELSTLLERLAERQQAAAIDLRSLPMSPQDRTELRRVLGEGEVQATVNAAGLSSVRETRISGVWWVEHRDAAGELIAELLEVTQVPAILASASDEIAAAARALREHMSAAARSC
jgi:hydrogenase-1 operon protein HyaF